MRPARRPVLLGQVGSGARGVLLQRGRARGDRHLGTTLRQAAEWEGVPYDHDAATNDATPDALASGLLDWLATDPTPAATRELARL